MTPEQEKILNNLLRLGPDKFTHREKLFLVMLSTRLRDVILSRREGVYLQKMGDDLIGWDRMERVGPPDRFGTWDVRPGPSTTHEGGPGETRPPGTGDGKDVPDDRGRVGPRSGMEVPP